MDKQEMRQQVFRDFHHGETRTAYQIMGCHRAVTGGFVFRVWAPHAQSVRVIGDFNGWNRIADSMVRMTEGGIWEITLPHAREGQAYKYALEKSDGTLLYRSDPYGFACEALPSTGSVIVDLQKHVWKDGAYRRARAKKNILASPINIYEVHLGSWQRGDQGETLSYPEIALRLAAYVTDMGYTHVELMPVTEYPFDMSWGYQVTGYYAPTFRYGKPNDFMEFVDILHRAGIGVILDWVPGHFPKDEQGLCEFDGDCCYELSDPLMNEHPEWKTRIFDYKRPEVLSFLVSNAYFWIKEYHIDGLRVDAVASMLYLDYARRSGQWRPNEEGGNINKAAVSFLQRANRAAFAANRNALMIAEDSTAFPLVTKPDFDGGLGFNLKWNMGWMNDTLHYMSLDPFFRKENHNDLTFSLTYAFSENYVLPLSHDEVVHGKRSLIEKMPGSYEEKFSGLRLLLSLMMVHPGKKLLFMGGEFGQFIEWNFQRELDWFLLDYESHRQMKNFTKTLNHFYLTHPALWQCDNDWNGFRWISCDDKSQSVVALRRIDRAGREVVAVLNFCPVRRDHYRIGLPCGGTYTLAFSSDDAAFGGNNLAIPTRAAEQHPMHGLPWSTELILPPLSAIFYICQKKKNGKKNHAISDAGSKSELFPSSR